MPEPPDDLNEMVRPVHRVGLEREDVYVRRVGAEIKRSKATAAIWVTMTLAGGIVAALPCYLLAVVSVEPDRLEPISMVFTEWFRAVTPILGAAVGALVGVSIVNSNKD